LFLLAGQKIIFVLSLSSFCISRGERLVDVHKIIILVTKALGGWFGAALYLKPHINYKSYDTTKTTRKLIIMIV
jgi:hypothetical protein